MSRFRNIAVVASVFASLGSVLMFIVGAAKTVKAYRIYFLGATLTSDPPPPPHLDASDQTMISIVESMDAFLIALVLIIFAGSVYNLFVRAQTSEAGPAPWLGVTSIERLKHVVIEVVLVLLAVLFLQHALILGEHLSWSSLVLPAGAALLALTIWLLPTGGH